MKYKIKKKLYCGFSYITSEYSRNTQIIKTVDLPFKNIQHYNALLNKIVLCYSYKKINFKQIINLYLTNSQLLNNYGKIKMYHKVIDDEYPHVCYAKIFWRSKTDKILYLLQNA
jgi:hypothetical protein